MKEEAGCPRAWLLPLRGRRPQQTGWVTFGMRARRGRRRKSRYPAPKSQLRGRISPLWDRSCPDSPPLPWTSNPSIPVARSGGEVSELHSNIGWKYTRHFHAEVSKNAADEPENTCGHTRLTQSSAILRASLKWSLLIKILALSILGMSIVFRSLIQSHVEPWHASSGGAEPNGSRPRSPLHQFSNPPPQSTLLSVGSLPDKYGNVSVSRQRTTGTRHYHLSGRFARTPLDGRNR